MVTEWRENMVGDADDVGAGAGVLETELLLVHTIDS